MRTGKPAKVVLEELLCKAADMPISWTVIVPKNGPEAGVSLKEVEKVMTNVFFTLRDVKGVVKTSGSREAMAKVDTLVAQSMLLWAHAQSLAKSTFYDDMGLAAGRRVFRLLSSWRAQLQAKMNGNSAEADAGNAEASQNQKALMLEYDEVLKGLTRLGFSPAGPIR